MLAGAPLVALASTDRPSGPVGRRASAGEPVKLAFNNRTIPETIDFIVDATGKAVFVRSQNIAAFRFTLINDEFISRDEAVNRLFEAFLQTDVAVIETPTAISIDNVGEVYKYILPVIAAEESVLERTDRGVFVTKVFKLKFATASSLKSVFDPQLPSWGKIEVDDGSNQIVLTGSIGLAQRLENLILALDRPSALVTRTFILKHTDAAEVAGWINTHFESSATPRQGQPAAPARPGVPAVRPPGTAGTDSNPPTGATNVQTRVTYDARQNSVTVKGDPAMVDQIEALIRDQWDRPFVDEDADFIRIYTIRFRDVIVVRDILQELIAGQAARSPGQGARPQGAGGGGAGSASTGPDQRLANQFRFQADANANQLIVIGRTSASFAYLDTIIDQLDQPGSSDLPIVYELKHADAGEVSQQINVLLAPANVQSDFTGRNEGLTTFNTADSLESGSTAGTGDNTQQNNITFPWQRARERTDVAPESHLIGKVRVVPVFRQNALLVLGPRHYQDQIVQIVDKLDRPGRQVLITAIIAEVQLETALSLGLRFSRGNNIFANRDNQFGGSSTMSGEKDNILDGLFDTSVLNVDVNLNAVLDLLKTDNDVRILSEPRIFTSDNEQANFFDGRDVQVVTDSQTTDVGTLNQSFDFRPVGIIFSARPRITANRDIDLLVSLELSSLSPSATQSGGLIIDRRITQTRVVVKNGQTIVISGILREEEADVKRKVPFFGDIPLLGALFTSTETGSVRSELIAFIRPIVVDNPDDNEQLNQPMRDRLDDLRRPLDEQKKNPTDAREAWSLDHAGGSASERSRASEDGFRE